ncbi:N-terminal nucleophile aminohydrolase [Aulographum hederae CBS 113979]|uniref:N-terminal nucleophile aminohydrolase n=1 Tax=Aulographum hederae CBS 113979 TaxID=1176131 RepID=A0A6G1HE45_9PEZI|nr:N-terminal nucleophile aminohydrolase [Aulographum hederae CBS 113979]
MCRWFAYISPEEPCLLADVLLNPENAISKQCSEHYLPFLLPHNEERELDDAKDKLLLMRNSLLNMDGLGIAWYTNSQTDYVHGVNGPHPALYKSQSPPTNDFNLKSLCNNTESLCVMAHVRATSGSVVTPVNNHPFAFGRHSFMHNGAISNFLAIKRDMTDMLSYDAYCNVLGTTDSEHLGALYMSKLTNNGAKATWEKQYPLEEMRDALVAAVIDVMKLQKEKLGSKNAPNSLNLCATDGRRMVTCRFRNHATQQPPSLYWSEFAGRILSRKYEGGPNEEAPKDDSTIKPAEECGKHTIISSEPTTYNEKDWHLIGRNSILMVDTDGVEREEEIKYDGELNAEDPNAPGYHP